jgi:uncharacterized membrane protein
MPEVILAAWLGIPGALLVMMGVTLIVSLLFLIGMFIALKSDKLGKKPGDD